MTKPTPPHASTANVVEIDAMDVMEWQHGQRTPQTSDANLAALVKQSARSHESAPVAEAARTPPLVARAKVSEAPPMAHGRPRASEPILPRGKLSPIATPTAGRPALRAGGGAAKPPMSAGARAEGTSPLPPVLVARAVTETPMVPVPVVRPSATQAAMPAEPPSSAGSGSAFPAIGTPPPSDHPMPSLPMSVGGYPIYRTTAPAPAMAPSETALDPAGYPSGHPAGYAAYGGSPVGQAPQRLPSPDPLAISDLSAAPPELRKLREAVRPRRRLLWIGGASGITAAVLAVIAMTGSASVDAPASAPVSAAASVSPDPAASTATAATPPAAAPTERPGETRPRFPEIVAHPAAPSATAPTRIAAAVPAPAHVAPARATPHGARRLGGKKIVFDYQTHADETPVPNLVAQASEDPAIARARSAYLIGNDKLFAGDAASAAAAYREALSLYPGYVGGYRGLGLAYAQLGDTKKALDALKTYVATAPGAKDIGLIKKRIARLQSK